MTQDSTLPHWKRAFPDFDGMTFEVPEGFVDNSWRNNVCPSFLNAELDLELYANYVDPSKREVDGSSRFMLAELEDGEHTDRDFLAHGEDFSEILAAIEARRAERAPKIG